MNTGGSVIQCKTQWKWVNWACNSTARHWRLDELLQPRQAACQSG